MKTSFMYPPDWIVRTVREQGRIKVAHTDVHIGMALVRERIALQPLGGASHRIWFRELDLGTVELPPPNHVIDAMVRRHLDRPLKKAQRRGPSKAA
ncbi:MAG: hypothetical protein R3B36_25030 [Polyangiaceae bacterium]